jgi:hypothetical protein
MDFPFVVPEVGNIVKIVLEDFVVEARVVGRTLVLADGSTQINLSDGSAARYKERLDSKDHKETWKFWYNREDIGDGVCRPVHLIAVIKE